MGSPRGKYRIFAIMLFLSAAPLLQGCGYEPLYGRFPAKNGGAIAQLENISINPIEYEVDARERLLTTGGGTERTAQLIRNSLQDQLTPQGKSRSPLYRLSIKVIESRSTALINVRDNATRITMELRANYTLTDVKTNAVTYQNKARAFGAYNVLSADYGNVIGEQDTRQRLAVELAENIRSGLGVFLNRQVSELR